MDASDLPRIALADALARLREMPPFVEGALAAAPPARRLARPDGAEFSLVEHACHLRDLEREGYLVRVRRLLAEAAPALDPFDGAAVAAERDYRAHDGVLAAREFAGLRRDTLALLAALDDAALGRVGTFEGRRVCLGDVVAMMVEHDRGHREEIARLAAPAGG